MAKTDWNTSDIVQPSHLNQIGEEINASAALASSAETPSGAQAKADAAALAGVSAAASVQSVLDTHTGQTSPHNATSAATANRLMVRDANGRVKVAAPSASDDVARKAEVDAVASSSSTDFADMTRTITMGGMV